MVNIIYEGEYKDVLKWCWIVLRILVNVKESLVKFVGIYYVKRWELKEVEGFYNDFFFILLDYFIWLFFFLWLE